jgi:hypothetical protein
MQRAAERTAFGAVKGGMPNSNSSNPPKPDRVPSGESQGDVKPASDKNRVIPTQPTPTKSKPDNVPDTMASGKSGI